MEAEIYKELAGLHRKIDIIMRAERFISRSQVIREIGETELANAIALGIIKPLKGRSRNSRILIERSEYERYIEYLKR